MALTKAQVKQLRGMGQQLRPLVIIGRNGLTDAVTKQTGETLDRRELVKVQVQPGAGEAREIADALAEATGAELVQTIGNRFVLYRRSSDPKAEHIDLVRG